MVHRFEKNFLNYFFGQNIYVTDIKAQKGVVCIILWRRFLKGQDFCTKIALVNDFVDGELHISLQPRNVKICEHSIFL